MTGRRLYDALTDAWAARNRPFSEDRRWLKAYPPAWAFLDSRERDTFDQAARALRPSSRRRKVVR